MDGSPPQQDELAAWLERKLPMLWRSAAPVSVKVLTPDASGRFFYRVELAGGRRSTPHSAVVVELGDHDLPPYVRVLKLLPDPPPEPPYLNVQRFLRSIGAPVPELYHADLAARRLLVEDVGATSVFVAARTQAEHVADLYRSAIKELLWLHVEGTRALDSRCVAAQISYDARLFRWEMNEFLEVGLPCHFPDAAVNAHVPELDELAGRLGTFARVFSHRDYHGANLFVQDGSSIRILDFQDALLAPHAQDLAVLLTTRDTTDLIDPALERRLLLFYLGGLHRRGAASMNEAAFFESYWLCVLQHALKVVGRFTSLERQGKGGYLRYVPYAVANARRALRELGDFPILSRTLATFGAGVPR